MFDCAVIQHSHVPVVIFQLRRFILRIVIFNDSEFDFPPIFLFGDLLSFRLAFHSGLHGVEGLADIDEDIVRASLSRNLKSAMKGCVNCLVIEPNPSNVNNQYTLLITFFIYLANNRVSMSSSKAL